MNADQLANLAFLGLLAAAIGGSYLMSQRGNLGKVTQQAGIWALIFVGVVAAYGLWSDLQRDVTASQWVTSDQDIAIPRAGDGHYYLTLKINDVPVNFVIDTGASVVVLSQQDARRVGLKPEDLKYFGSANTANGIVETAAVWLETVTLGPITDQNLRAVVNAGEMNGSLLGMTYLGLYDRISIEGDQMILSR